MGINSTLLYLLSIVEPAIILTGLVAFIFALIALELLFIYENNNKNTYRDTDIEALIKRLEKSVHKLEKLISHQLMVNLKKA